MRHKRKQPNVAFALCSANGFKQWKPYPLADPWDVLDWDTGTAQIAHNIVRCPSLSGVLSLIQMAKLKKHTDLWRGTGYALFTPILVMHCLFFRDKDRPSFFSAGTHTHPVGYRNGSRYPSINTITSPILYNYAGTTVCPTQRPFR